MAPERDRAPFLRSAARGGRRRGRRGRRRTPTLGAGSPFATPGYSRRSAHSTRRPSGRRAPLLAVLPAALLVVWLATGATGSPRRNPTRLAHLSGRTDAARQLPRSPSGLPLGAAPLALSGIGSPGGDAIQQYFAHPPSAALLFDLRTGRVLWQLNPYRRRPIASLTKMMTALIAAKSLPDGSHVPISRAAASMAGSRVGLLPVGKSVQVEPLLYGLLLPSGNDAANALAERIGGSIKGFVKLMNEEAARIGLGCTHYSSPSGFYDRDNFSCAADLAQLAAADLAQARLARIVGSRTATLRFPVKGGKLYLTNNNPLLLYGYQGADGVKTGYTEAAGTCLVASAERHGVKLGVVLLGSPAPGTQAQRLLDDAFHQIYGQAERQEATIPGGA